MRFLFAGFLALHGLAHLVGFLTPWGLVRAPAAGTAVPTNTLFGGRITLSDFASRVASILWLLAAIAFVIVALGLWRQASWWRASLAVIVLISLALTIAWWPISRVGVAINVALLVSMSVSVYLAFRADIRIERARASSRSVMISTSAGPIEYADVGRGSPVLVLHGTGGGWDQGINASRALGELGFRLIAPSRFGYLRTPLPPDPSPANEADAWAALLDELHIERAAVISYSAGAAPAVQMALRHPHRVSQLVLVVPAAGGILSEKAEGPPAWVMNAVLKYDFPFWAAMHVSRRTMLGIVAVPASLVPRLAPEDLATLDATIRAILPVSLRKNGIMNDARTQSGSDLYPIDRITVPTMLISASDDLYETLRVARYAVTKIPDARLLAFPSGGHLLLGNDRELWPRVATFLEQPRIAAASPAREYATAHR